MKRSLIVSLSALVLSLVATPTFANEVNAVNSEFYCTALLKLRLLIWLLVAIKAILLSKVFLVMLLF